MRVIDCIELLGEVIPIERLRLSGKLTRLDGLTGLIADASGMAVEIAQAEEIGLQGIARLALAGLDADERHLSALPATTRRREPRWSQTRADRIRARWLAFAAAAIDLSSSR